MSAVKSYKIVVIVTYFGKFPWYFHYFLHSCKFNKTIDFLIFTDNQNEFELPENVKIVNKSLQEIKALACKKLRLQVAVDFPYKLCDFKPAYGLIFEDYTRGYHFWGQSDIDVIFGDLRGFFTSNLLASSDFISVRHDYVTGCFTLCRNNSFMNSFFKRSRDCKKVMTSPVYYGFDEMNFKHCELTEGRKLEEIETEIESFTHIIKHASQNNEINAHFDFIMIEGLPGKIGFNKGKLVYNNKYEAVLYHLYWLKKIYTPKKNLSPVPDRYFISSKRIYFKKPKQ